MAWIDPHGTMGATGDDMGGLDGGSGDKDILFGCNGRFRVDSAWNKNKN